MKPPRREELAALIASPCLLRRDRAGRAFFISDFERRLADAPAAARRLEQAGFCLRREGGLVLIDWPPERYLAFYRALPPARLPQLTGENAALWGLCAILGRHGPPLEDQNLPVLAQALRLARLGDSGGLLRLLRGELAESLRLRKAPPAHAARLLALLLNGQHQEYLGR